MLKGKLGVGPGVRHMYNLTTLEADTLGGCGFKGQPGLSMPGMEKNQLLLQLFLTSCVLIFNTIFF